MTRALILLGKGALRLAIGFIFSTITIVIVLSGYLLCKLHPLAMPVQLHLTELDRMIPLVPWTVWLYRSMAEAIFAAWIFVPNVRIAWRLLLGISIGAAICWIFFFFYPTTYPRDLFPITNVLDSSASQLHRVRLLDDPTNCFPSMHVALVMCIALTMLEYGFMWPGRVAIMLWAVAVSISTLTTKQHYVVDVLAGACTGVFAYLAARWAASPHRTPIWNLGLQPIQLSGISAREVITKIRAKFPERAWSVSDLPWPAEASGKKLTPKMVEFISQVIYVEEIAGKSFDLLAGATDDEDLHVLYTQFAEDERRHAEGLRHVLQIHGETPTPPGLGSALLLQQTLDPKSDADAMLVAISIPVFETFLDAGTIPFLRRHPALAGDAFEKLIRNICRDESSHLAVNWNVGRGAARAVKSIPLRSWGGLRLLLNPSVLRGALATPLLAMDVYGHAYGLGFDFRALLPSFRRLFSLHRVYPEFAWYPPWFLFRVFVVCGVIATWVVIALDRLAPRLIHFIVRVVTRATNWLAAAAFADAPADSRLSPSAPFIAKSAAVVPGSAIPEGEI